MNLEKLARKKLLEIARQLRELNIPCDRFCITGYVEKNPLMNFRIYSKDVDKVKNLFPVKIYEAISNNKIKHIQIEYLQIQ